jgi:galactosyl transferase GMA12/MNN10 family
MSEAPITILTLAIGADYKANLAECLASKRAYAARHGYRYIQGEEEWWDRERPIAWSKLGFWKAHLEKAEEGALFWISDADVYITNEERTLDTTVLPLFPPSADILMTFDSCGHENSGNMLFRNSPWLRSFLDRVWNQTEFLYHIWWENGAISHLYHSDLTVRAKIEVTQEARSFNAYLMGHPGAALWEPGDLLVHFAGIYDSDQMRGLIARIKVGETPRLDMYNPKKVLA